MIKISEYSLDEQIYATFRKLKTFGKLSNASSRFFLKKTARYCEVLLERNHVFFLNTPNWLLEIGY